MKYAYARKSRLEKALEYRGVNASGMSGAALLIKNAIWRGMSQAEAAGIIDRLLSYIEPPNCWMSHCPDYGGVTCFCNCARAHHGNLIPGRCNRNKEFKARQKVKAQKDREKSYDEFKRQCADYPCIHYTGKFCEHMQFTDNNKIKNCHKVEVVK